MPKPFLAGNCEASPIGTRVIDSTPAAITMSMVPDITACAAKCSACCDEPHWRSTEVPGTLSGSFDATLDGIRGVKLIAENGKLTAASASQICDGASGVMVVNERGLKSLGIKPMARVHHMTMVGGDPVIMLDAPLHATERALKKAGMSIDDIDLFEVNEAFASVPTAWLKTTGADPARLNVNGGAIALGHPLGGSGTKLMTTLINALKQRNKRYGLQTMCEGGGMANVTIVERL